MNKGYTLFCLFFILISRVVFAQEIIIIDKGKKNVNISKQIYILEDPDNQFDSEDISKNTFQNRFKKNQQTSITLAGKKKSTWLKFNLQNRQSQKIYLKLEGVTNDIFEAYIATDKIKLKPIKKLLDFSPLSQKKIPANIFIIPLQQTQDTSTHTIYIRFYYTGNFNTSVVVDTLENLYKQNHQKDIFYSVFYGAILMMAIYNLFIYFSVQDSNYLYYVFYTFCRGAFSFIAESYFSELFEIESPLINQRILFSIFHLYLILSVLFAISFLNTAKHLPIAHKSLIGIIILLIISYISSLINAYWLDLTWQILTTSIMIYLFVLSVFLYFKGNKVVRFYILGHFFYMLGDIFALLKHNQYILQDYPTIYPYPIGVALEILLFSFALADRINILVKERQAAQKENLKLINEQNIMLETKVKERTEELLEKNQEIEAQNEELCQQREELMSSNQDLAQKSQKIAIQNETLRQQKSQIELLKNNLEDLVSQRTQELEQTLDNLTQQNQDLEQFSFIISHNLRSPVARILGLMEIFDEKNYEADLNKEIISYLKKTTFDLDTVIKDLTQIITIRSDLNKIKEDIDVREIIQSEKSLLRDELKKSNLSIHIEDLKIKEIHSIKGYFQSILHNLLSNAIKYKSEERPPIVYIKTEQIGHFICLSVQDNGLGIDLQKVNPYKIFGLYQRVHSHIEGKGLGLFLVKTQIESLGGKIEVESALGIGTTFKVYFPV